MLLVLLACTDGRGAPPPADTDRDSADSRTDTSGGTDTAPDTSGTAGLSWPATTDAPDVRVAGCGSTEDMGEAIAGDGDLDGDALPELAVGAPGHDEIAVDRGAVYVFLGSALGGDMDLTAAHAVVRGTGDTDEDGSALERRFGSRVDWLGDLDGDGLSELAVWRSDDHFSVFEGSTLAGGGELTDADAAALHAEEDATIVPYPDLDGDGLDDVALGLPNRGMSESVGYRGTVALASGLALLDGALPTLREVYGYEAEAHAGAGLTLIEDDDGDGWPDLATSLEGDVVILGSAAVRSAGTLFADDAVTARWEGPEPAEAVTAIGDADGGGRVDLAVWYGGSLYALRGEDRGGAVEDAPLVDCGWSCQSWSPAHDLDGDGVDDLWIVASGGAYAVSGAAFLAGTADPSAPLAQVSTAVSIYGITVADATDGVWVGISANDRYGTPSGGAARFQVEPGDTLEADAADATITSAWVGWQPSDPVFVELTGDGIPELVFEDEDAAGIAVFDGARLAAGGSFSLCAADWLLARDGEPVAWLEDGDRDGAAEVLLRQGDNLDVAFSVRGGRALLGLEPDDLRVVRATRRVDAQWDLRAACDVTGDGRLDYVEFDGEEYADVVDGRAWVDGYDEGLHLLGRLDGADQYSSYGCLDDLDEDGGAELVSEYYLAFFSSALDPATTLGYGDEGMSLERSTVADGYGFHSFPVPLGDLDGDSLSDYAFVTAVDVGVHDDIDRGIVLVPGSAFAAGVELHADDYPPALTLAGDYTQRLGLLGTADVDGDALLDALVLWRDGSGDFHVLAAPATELLAGAADTVGRTADLLEISGGDSSVTDPDIDLGPDYGGAGPAIVVESEDPVTAHRVISLVFAR